MKRYALLIVACIVLTAPVTYAKQVPDMTLPDPHGGKHHLPTLAKSGGLVLVMTAPKLKDRSAQVAWSKLLTSTRGSHPGTFVMVEDMSEAFIKSIALHEMKEHWKPGDVPLLLVDNTNTLYKRFGVGEDETVVFAYNKHGRLVDRYSGAPSKAQARAIWDAVEHG